MSQIYGNHVQDTYFIPVLNLLLVKNKALAKHNYFDVLSYGITSIYTVEMVESSIINI